MAGEVSFDVVSDFDEQELRNALDQVRREVIQRYDFKGARVDLSQEKTQLVLVTDDEFRARSVRDLVETKAVRRELSLKIFDWGPVEPSGGNRVRQVIGLRRGLADDLARSWSSSSATSSPKSSPGSRATRSASRARARTSCSESSPGCASWTRLCRCSSRTTARSDAVPGARAARIVMIVVALLVVAGLIAAMLATPVAAPT
jgi:hypothetical protein